MIASYFVLPTWLEVFFTVLGLAAALFAGVFSGLKRKGVAEGWDHVDHFCVGVIVFSAWGEASNEADEALLPKVHITRDGIHSAAAKVPSFGAYVRSLLEPMVVELLRSALVFGAAFIVTPVVVWSRVRMPSAEQTTGEFLDATSRRVELERGRQLDRGGAS